MKNIIKVSVIVLALLLNITFPAMAQYDIQDFILNKKISRGDSVRLVHYLVGCGAIHGEGNFVKNRKVYLDSALAIVPWSAELWVHKAFPLLYAGKYEIGMPYMDSAVKYDREGFIGRRGYMKCIFQKHYREAIADLYAAKEIEHGPGQVEDHPYNFFIGIAYLQLNRFDSSEALFKTSIKEVSSSNGYGAVNYLEWFYLGITMFEQDDYPGAIACFDSCLGPYPKFSDAKFYKAWCLKELEQYKPALELMTEAKKDFTEGSTINDDNAHIEPYPYQISKYNLDHSLEILDKQ